MINGISPISLSAFNAPDSRIQVLANNNELVNSNLLGNAANLLPSSLLNPTTSQFLLVQVFVITVGNPSPDSTAQLAAYGRLIKAANIPTGRPGSALNLLV